MTLKKRDYLKKDIPDNIYYMVYTFTYILLLTQGVLYGR
jgi:hypothetical protein